MPLYDYKCQYGIQKEVPHRITERPKVVCICGMKMKKQVGASVIKWNTNCPTASGGK